MVKESDESKLAMSTLDELKLAMNTLDKDVNKHISKAYDNWKFETRRMTLKDKLVDDEVLSTLEPVTLRSGLSHDEYIEFLNRNLEYVSQHNLNDYLAENTIDSNKDIDENIDENIDEDIDENIDEDIDENIDDDIDDDIDENIDDDIDEDIDDIILSRIKNRYNNNILLTIVLSFVIGLILLLGYFWLIK